MGDNALKILILGADGYLGWPTCMNFAAAGHEVYAVDNYMRRIISEATASEALYSTPNLSERVRVFKDLSGKVITVEIGDLADPEIMLRIVRDFQA